MKDYWLDQHKNSLNFIEQNNLLTPFYRTIFKEVYSVGVSLSSWQSLWTKNIINGINKELSEKFNNNNSEVMEFLRQNNLLDIGHGGVEADRSYSMVVNENGTYKSNTH